MKLQKKILPFILIALTNFCFSQVNYLGSGLYAGSAPFLRTVSNSTTTNGTIILRDTAGGSINTNIWSRPVALPFSFNFYGVSESYFCVSKNGLLTFDTTVNYTTVNSNLNNNTKLPNNNLPYRSIAWYWGDFNGISSGDHVYTYTHGSSPNRQFYIQTYSYKMDALSFTYNFLVLEESTNRIYMIDGYNSTAVSGTFTVGVQQNSVNAIQISGSPNLPLYNTSSAITDDDYYLFSPFDVPFNDAGIESIDTPLLQPCTLSRIAVTLENKGKDTLKKADIVVLINSGMSAISWTGNLAPNSTIQVSLGTFTFNSGDTLAIWTEKPNGIVDSFTYNDTMRRIVYQAMAGTYTIGVSGNYSRFNAAATALLNRGVCGHVTFIVDPSSGPYNEQVVFGAIGGVGPNATVKFRGQNTTLIFAPTVSADRFVIKLDGTDYFTFDSLNIVVDTTSATYGWCVNLTNGSDHNTISNCKLLTSYTNTTAGSFAGIVLSGSTTSATTATSGDYNTIINNMISGGYYSITMVGSSANPLHGNQLIGNQISDFYMYGSYLSYQDSAIVRGNDVSRPYRTTLTTGYSLYFANPSNRMLIEKNKVHDLYTKETTSTSSAYGIYLTSADADSSTPNVIANNIIYNLKSNGTIYGFYNSGSAGAHYYFNTVSLDDANATAGITRGFYQTSLAINLKFKNNNISIRRGGSGVKYAIYLSTSTTEIESDNNNLYLNSAGSGSQNVGYYNANDYSTLANWQTANGGIYDAKSVNVNPLFENLGANNLKPKAATLNNIGTPITGLSTDFNEITRDSTNPDPGAFEFTPPPYDAGITALVNPVGQCAGTTLVSVKVKNFGSVSLDSLKVFWTIDDTLQAVYQMADSIQSGKEQTVILGNMTLVEGVFKTLKIWSSEPNGFNDIANSNDTLKVYGITAAMKGTFSIGSGKTYGTFSSAVSDLKMKGVCGPVVFDIDSSIYNEQIEITYLDGSSSANTITFKGNGATVRFAPTNTNDRHIIRLNGADYLIFENLNILLDTSISSNYGWTLQMGNGSNYNKFLSCRFMSSLTSTSSNYSTIVATGSNTAFSATSVSHNLFQNCSITGGYYGLRLSGNNGAEAYNNQVINCTIKDFYIYGLYMDSNDSTLLKGNDINRYNRTGSTFYGIYNTGSTNSIIENNKIHNSHDYSTSTTAAYGIYFTAADSDTGRENNVINNLIYNLNNNSTIYGIYNSSSNGVHYYYNTVSLDDQNATAGITRGFYQLTAATNIVFKNNIISITRGGDGVKHALYFGTNTSSITSDYNDLYVDSKGSGTQSVGYYGGDFTTLANWQTANSSAYDINSKAQNPIFSDLPKEELIPSSSSINNAGTPITGITKDFANNIRDSLKPDMGAFEFNPPANDVRIKALIAPMGGGCGDTGISVTVSIANLGLNLQTAVPVTVEISGPINVKLTGISYDSLLSASESIFTMPETISTTSGGIFYVKAYTLLAADSKKFNDTLFTSFEFGAKTSPPTTTSAERCGPGTVTLKASGSSTLRWFYTDTSATSFLTDSVFTANLSATKTYYVQANESSRNRISTLYTGTTSTFTGNYFNIQPNKNLVIDSFDINTSATSSIDVAVYYKQGTYVGSETNASAWTLADSVKVIGTGTGNQTRIGVKQFTLYSGQTYGIFIVISSGGNIVYSSTGNNFTNNDMTLIAGAGINGVFTGSLVSPRTWNGTIYYSAENCPSFRTPVTAIINPIPDVTIAPNGPTTFCQGKGVEISVPVSSLNSYQWRLDGQNIMGANAASYTAFNSGNYSVGILSNKGCSNLSGNIAINAVANPPAVTFPQGNQSICANEIMTLTANSGTGLQHQWLKDGSNILGDTNAIFKTNQAGTYSVKINNDLGCTSLSDSVILKVNAVPVPENIAPQSVCKWQDAVFSGADSTLIYLWYNLEVDGNLLSDERTLTIKSMQQSDSVYLSVSDGVCQSSRTMVIAEVKPLPELAVVRDTILCEGTFATLNASYTSGSAIWFDAPTGGNIIGTGAAFNTGILQNTTKFYVQTELNGCTSVSRTKAEVLVHALPETPIAFDTSFCFGNMANLFAQSPSKVRWFKEPTSKTPLFEGTTFRINNMIQSDTFYIDGYANGCASQKRQRIIVSPITLPAKPIVNNTAACEGDATSIAATAPIGLIEWYEKPEGGMPLGTGSTFSIPSLTKTMVLFAGVNDGKCNSERQEAFALKNEKPDAGFSLTLTVGPRLHFEVNQPQPGIQYFWDFGDGSQGSGDSVTHTYPANGIMKVKLSAVNPVTFCFDSTTSDINIITTGVNDFDKNLTAYNVFPNPYRGTAYIAYQLVKNTNVKLEVFDLVGKLIAEILDEKQAPGSFTYTLKTNGQSSEGIYFVRFTVDGQSRTIKVIDLGR
jgi:hypothetical protein